jgi:hypothetical protein
MMIMSHNPDFQKDEIMAAMKREYESHLAWAQSQPREFSMQRIGGLASGFESIMYAPDLPTDEMRVRLLAWAIQNRPAIASALRSYDAEQVPA